MIYRVGDGDNPAYDYSSQLKPARNTEGQEKFSLEHQKEQTASQKKEEKGEDKKLHEKPGVDIKKQGVRLELSGGRDRSAPFDQESSSGENENAAGAGLLGSLSGIVQGFLQAVKDLFYRIWNDTPPEEVTSSEVTPEEAARYTEEYYAMKGISPPQRSAEPEMEENEKSPESVSAEQEEKIRKSLRSGNLEQVISLLTEDGRRTIAKNSTLLTYYDKNGRLTQINASDRERILHGDRHTRTL